MYTCCSLNLNIAVSNQQIAELGRACVEFGFMGNFRNRFDAILHIFVHLGMIFFFPMKIFLAFYIIFEVLENGLSFSCVLWLTQPLHYHRLVNLEEYAFAIVLCLFIFF